ncbi:hypothetical protein KGQ20_14945 [Catenulispora sp. NF23]|uniref:hypothetical protein n=1 Tax=Catenulispora pinistramenti TaxID=2705254 RepID=UPI001BA5AD71|nr:hypothetical protein [Catenulispora pinistramenti]MBS2534069.1 hypothetical protein [Catenulispora pinistramenti]
MWLDVFFDGLEQLVDKLHERWPHAAFWTILALWSAAAAIPTLGAALTGAGWFSILVPLAPLLVIALTYWRGVEWIPTPAWVAALTMWAILPGGLTYAGTTTDAARAGLAAFLFCYGQLLVALLKAICERRGFSVDTSFAQLRLMRLKLLAAAFPLILSFRANTDGPVSAQGWHVIAEPVVCALVLVACALPGPRTAFAAALAVAVGAWALLDHSNAHDRWALIGENGWLWLAGCYQWFRAARKDFWNRDHSRAGY